MDYRKMLLKGHDDYVGDMELFITRYDGLVDRRSAKKPTIIFLHGAYTGSWMWVKYLPHFIERGYSCVTMNLRGHYKSRSCDLSKVTLDDYVEDVQRVIHSIKGKVILCGFSMGGLVAQKIAELEELEGLVLIDSSLSINIYEKYELSKWNIEFKGNVVEAPIRDEIESVDESVEDIKYQVKLLSMESRKALEGCKGVNKKYHFDVDEEQVKCPVFVLKAVNNEEENRIGSALAKHYDAEYYSQRNATHTGVLVGQRYKENVDVILDWIEKNVI